MNGLRGLFRDAMIADFARVSNREIDSARIERGHDRRLEMFLGEGFAPKPRR